MPKYSIHIHWPQGSKSVVLQKVMTDFDSAEFVYDVNSYQTALAIIPPASLTKDINALRAAYDKSFHSWAPHINLIYPFVRLESLNAATARIQHALLEANLPRIHLRLNEHGMFTHRHSSTIYRTCGDNSKLQLLRRLILDSLGKVTGPEEFIPHLTVGQSTPGPSEGRESLLTKTRMLPTIEWPLVDLAILQRQEDRTMKLWGRIRVSADEDISPCISKLSTEEEEAAVDSQISGTAVSGDVQEGITHRFDPSAGLWNPLRVASSVKSFGQMPTSLRISTYNVLIDSVYSARERCTTLLRTILSEAARADIVVLQEVSDEFLCHLLGDTETRQQYPYVTHAPPNQAGVAPLVNLRNIVILSRRSFRWEYVPFERRHKGAVVIKLDHIGNSDEDGNFSPLVLAGLHLTCGLTDGSVAAKASQLRNLIDHLQAKYAQNLWVVAGDFNLTTSKWTIDAALKTKSISLQTARTLVNLDEMLAEVALVDSYVFTRAEHDLKQADDDDDDVYDGEEGATFNPRDNLLAAKIVGREFGNRPQRYDKIYVKGNDQLRITGYNMFGLPDSNEKNDILHYGSDHWGVRTTLGPPAAFSAGVNDKYKDDSAVLNDLGASSVGDNERLKQLIRAHHTFPGQEEMHRRQEIFSFIKDILLQLASAETRVSLVAVPVGSYGLDVWTTSSDIDCLCIGSISSKTFFALAIQRLRRHSGEGVRILRKVEAHTGTMLELDVQGVHMDIQYCAAAGIAETWPAALSASATDPLFSLSQQTLSKLKAIRDMVYLQETTSDLPAFRTAYRFINLWASSRGIYAARFGFLGGLHISLMLNRVTKLFHSRTVASGAGGLDAACIIRAFFHYYAAFDWTKDAVKDPFLSTAPGMGRAYHRRAGEPMVILGFHVPYVNVARAATVPTVRVISDEIKRANELGMKYVAESESLSWNSILGERGDGVFDFLNSYKSYVRIDVQYWGNKGIELVGWLESRFPTLLVGE